MASSDLNQARRVLQLAGDRAPKLGNGRLICLDGPAGSGKTSLAAALADQGPCAVLHLDDLLGGWDYGLARMVQTLVTDVLEPLAHGRPAAYHRWDWWSGEFAEWVPVPPVPRLVVEGVGAGSRAVADYASVLVWMEADHSVRLHRCLSRDGDSFAPHWESWARQEAEHFTAELTRDRSDLVISTDTGTT